MVAKTPREIWSEQFEAARGIKVRYGARSAFDYIIAEKLMTFADVARHHPEFASELPQFVAAVRTLFDREEMSESLGRLAGELAEAAAVVPEDDDLPVEEPAEVAARLQQFTAIRELLVAATIGTA